MECFCTLLVVAALATGITMWVRRSNRKSSPTPTARQDDRTARDWAEAQRANRTVGPADVAKAEAVVDSLVRVLGNSAATYNALANISRAGGAGPFDEIITRAVNDPGMLDRPWWWLAATAEQAVRDGKQVATAKIGAFTEMFAQILLPRLNFAGQVDAGLGKPPDAARARIGAAALAALERFPPELTVLGHHQSLTLNDGTSMELTVGAIERYIATTLLDLQSKGITVAPAGLERARAVLAGQRGPTREATAVRTASDGALADEVAALALAGQLDQALAEGTRQLSVSRITRGDEDPATLRAAAALGFAQLRAGQLYEVVSTLEPVYPVAVRVLGDGDFTTLRIAFCLGSALRETERPERARDILQPAIAAATLSLGADDATTLTLRCELAATFTTLGEHEQAVALHRQVLAERTRVLGPDHTDTLTSGDYLGRALRESGDLEAAIAQYEATLAATRAALGPDHPDTLSSQNNLAGAYSDAGRQAEATALYEQTLAARRRVLGPTHVHTLNSMNNLALAYLFDSKRKAEGLALLEEAAALAKGSLAAGHPLIANLEVSLLMARSMAAPPPAADKPIPPRRLGRRGPLRELVTLANPGKGGGFDVAWSPRGDRLAVAGFDDSVVVYDPASGATLARSPKLGTVGCVAWSPDATMLAAGTSQRTIHLLDAATGAERQRAHGHRDELRSIDFSPDGQLIATCANDGTIGIWRAADLAAVTLFPAHEGLARSVSWSPDGSVLVSGGGDGPVRTWHTGSWLPGVVRDGHTGNVSRVAFSPDGRFLASGSLDSTARVYDLQTDAEHRMLSAEGWWVIDLAFSPDSSQLVMLTRNDVLVFDLATGEVLAHGERPFGSTRLSWGSHGQLAIVDATEVVIWALPE